MDFGVELTKCVVVYNKDYIIFDVNSQFATVSSVNDTLLQSYSPYDSYILNVDSAINGNKILGEFVNGELQKKEFLASNESLKFTKSKTKKYKQDVIILILQLAIFKAYQQIKLKYNVDDSSLLVDFVFLFNKNEIAEAKSCLNTLIHEITTVNTVFPKDTISVQCNSIKYFPKGYSALASCLFNTDKTYNKANKQYLGQKIIVLDIGTLESSCIVSNNNSLVDYYYNYPYGLDKILVNIRTNLLLEGNVIKVDDIIDFTRTGDSVYKASLIKNISIELNRFFADFLNSLTQDLNNNSIDFSTMQTILVCGKVLIFDDIENIITSIVNEKLNKNFNLVKIPDLSDIELKSTDLNILGACILSDFI